ncbi:class 3 adenylate cyclase [Granulicella aggregans]|uniref:Class 3 adenylate cyclase n=1 Tax=Granulicella aggregans TaxID=474949 RepID=A0A7W7ZB91_9BACT|nr:adenylate/guanylate cyclase domain-containing protein [Granulicella aggregans]MBB5056608.1 class 3 adenylate cyclase [Granulicella aggregans]
MVKSEQSTNYSAAIWTVWKMAAVIAEQDHTQIQPVQFLSCICSQISHADIANLGEPNIKTELDEVAKVFDTHGLYCNEMLQRLQPPGTRTPLTSLPPSQLSGRDPVSRSAVTKRAFEFAVSAAAQESMDKARLRHLVAGILEHDRELCAVLGIDPVQRAELATDLSINRSYPKLSSEFAVPHFQKTDSTADVLRAVDANSILNLKIDWSVVGPKYQELCEMAWKVGACGKVGPLLQSVIEKMLEFIPRATHGAILILDRKNGSLDLMAQAPRGEPSLSMTSARQAIDTKQAFVWQSHRDMTKTQFDSHLESGIYAPIIADDRCFGVICLNSKSGGHRLTDEDLSLAVTLGHQIGLVFSNRDLKTELTQNVKILERLMPNFSPKVSKHLVDRAKAGELKLGGQLSDVTILSADIRGFTVMAAEMETGDLIALLNDYFAAMVECVFAHGGTIDKFIGDALLVVFNSPEPLEHHIEQAAKTALALQVAAQGVSERRRISRLRACEIGIGVHTGEVIHGFIGSAERMEFTIIGDAVNLTSRYCSSAGPGDIIISPQVYEKIWHSIQVKAIEVATKHEGNLNAYKLLGLKSS